MKDVSRFVEVFVDDVRELGGYALIVGGTPRDVLQRRLRTPGSIVLECDPSMEHLLPARFFRKRMRSVSILGSKAVSVQLGGFSFSTEKFKDLDFEVYGLSVEQVRSILEKFAKVEQVGRSFGVFKVNVDGTMIDVSLPRTESKEGRGHKGFIVNVDPTMTPAAAASRRDFTINTMALDPVTWTIYDFHGGIRDLVDGVLRHTSMAFAEDPLRVLRGMQFRGRMGIPQVTEETLSLCRSLLPEYHTLAKERLWEEWSKWAGKSTKPSLGLDFLLKTGWINAHPELVDLVDTPQNPAWHPEGNVWQHTLLVADAAAEIADREHLSTEDRTILVLAALCHDLGKPWVTAYGDDGMIRSKGHAEVGEPVAIRFLESIGAPSHVVGPVSKLVRHHLAHLNGTTTRSVRRLARLLEKGDEPDGTAKDQYRCYPATIGLLVNLVEADHSGRHPLPGGLPPEAVTLRDIAWAEDLRNQAAKPLLLGRHLLSHFEVKPGPTLGKLLAAAYSAQEEGIFVEFDEALLWVEREHGVARRPEPIVFRRADEDTGSN